MHRPRARPQVRAGLLLRLQQQLKRTSSHSPPPPPATPACRRAQPAADPGSVGPHLEHRVGVAGVAKVLQAKVALALGHLGQGALQLAARPAHAQQGAQESQPGRVASASPGPYAPACTLKRAGSPRGSGRPPGTVSGALVRYGPRGVLLLVCPRRASAGGHRHRIFRSSLLCRQGSGPAPLIAWARPVLLPCSRWHRRDPGWAVPRGRLCLHRRWPSASTEPAGCCSQQTRHAEHIQRHARQLSSPLLAGTGAADRRPPGCICQAQSTRLLISPRLWLIMSTVHCFFRVPAGVRVASGCSSGLAHSWQQAAAARA